MFTKLEFYCWKKKKKMYICNFYAVGKVNLVNLKKATSKYSLNEKWIQKRERERERVMKFVCFFNGKTRLWSSIPCKKKKKYVARIKKDRVSE